MGLLQNIRKTPQLPDALDVGYHVLLDKDTLAADLPPPTYTAHIPQPPTNEEFQALVEEFWWESTYVAKNLWRDELMFAKYNLDVVMKLELLRKLLEWQVELDHNWSWKPGMLGRGLKKMVKSETWSAVAATYVGPSIEDNWKALFRTTDVFRSLAVNVVQRLGYTYPHPLDERVMAYLRAIQALEK